MDFNKYHYVIVAICILGLFISDLVKRGSISEKFEKLNFLIGNGSRLTHSFVHFSSDYPNTFSGLIAALLAFFTVSIPVSTLIRFIRDYSHSSSPPLFFKRHSWEIQNYYYCCCF